MKNNLEKPGVGPFWESGAPVVTDFKHVTQISPTHINLNRLEFRKSSKNAYNDYYVCGFRLAVIMVFVNVENVYVTILILVLTVTSYQ